MFECDLYWSREVGYGTSITLETGGDDWGGQTKHKVICTATFGDIIRCMSFIVFVLCEATVTIGHSNYVEYYYFSKE